MVSHVLKAIFLLLALWIGSRTWPAFRDAGRRVQQHPRWHDVEENTRQLRKNMSEIAHDELRRYIEAREERRERKKRAP